MTRQDLRSGDSDSGFFGMRDRTNRMVRTLESWGGGGQKTWALLSMYLVS